MEQKIPPQTNTTGSAGREHLSLSTNEKDESHSPRIIRTMRSDATEAIKNQHETSVSIAVAEERKRAAERVTAPESRLQDMVVPPAPRKVGKPIIVFGVSLVVIVVISILVIFLQRPKEDISATKPAFPTAGSTTTPNVMPQLAPSIIPAQSERRFNVSTETPAQVFIAIATDLGKGTPASTIKNFFFVDERDYAISATQFFEFLNARPPEIIRGYLEKNFMIGFFGEPNGGASPFIILKVSDHDTALAGMLAWEAGLPSLFDSIFGTHLSSTESSNAKFTDSVILKTDIRTLVIPGGTISYGFATPSTIIIAGSTTAITELISLATKK